MGFSQAIAAAIVFGAVAVSAYSVTGTWMDSRRDLDVAWLEANKRAEFVAGSRADITSVSRTGLITTVRADNAGLQTLDGAQLTLFFNGVPVTPTSRQVEGKTTDVWAPGQEIVFRVSYGLTTPTSVHLVGEPGNLDSWRA